MMYATDFNVWKDQYYLGDAEIDVWPVNKQTSEMYTPLERDACGGPGPLCL